MVHLALLWSQDCEAVSVSKNALTKDSNYSQKKAQIRTNTNIIMAYHACQNEVKRKSRRYLFWFRSYIVAILSVASKPDFSSASALKKASLWGQNWRNLPQKSLTKQRKWTEKKLSFGIWNTNKKTNTLTGEKLNPVCNYVNYRNGITYNGSKPWSLILAGNYPARDLFGQIIYLWLFTTLIWISLRLWSFLSCTLRNRSTLIW